MSSGHNKHKGFSQTSKRFDGDLKAQQQQAHAKQLDPKRSSDQEEDMNAQKNSSSSAKNHKA